MPSGALPPCRWTPSPVVHTAEIKPYIPGQPLRFCPDDYATGVTGVTDGMDTLHVVAVISNR